MEITFTISSFHKFFFSFFLFYKIFECFVYTHKYSILHIHILYIFELIYSKFVEEYWQHIEIFKLKLMNCKTYE